MKTDNTLVHSFIRNHSEEALLLIETSEDPEIIELMNSLPVEIAAQLVTQMDRSKALSCLEKLEIKSSAEIFQRIPSPKAELLLRQIEPSVAKPLIDELISKNPKLSLNLLQYPERTVGAYTNPNIFTLTEELLIKDCLYRIKKSKIALPHEIYVLNRQQALVGKIDVKDLLTNQENMALKTIMNTSPEKILATRNIDLLFKNNGLEKHTNTLPVVDANDIFLGVFETTILLDQVSKQKKFDQHAFQAAVALGELYKIGLTSIYRGASQIKI